MKRIFIFGICCLGASSFFQACNKTSILSDEDKPAINNDVELISERDTANLIQETKESPFDSNGTIQKQDSNNTADADSSIEKFTKKTSEGEVTIDLEPLGYNDGVLSFIISLNTHSVETGDIDLKKQIKLAVDSTEYFPVEVPPLGGHHKSGTLEFELPEQPNQYDIIITGVPDIEERIISWP